jgi:hypothetical protein
MMPYQHSRWRQVFHAIVATTSPGFTPSRFCAAEASIRERRSRSA